MSKCVFGIKPSRLKELVKQGGFQVGGKRYVVIEIPKGDNIEISTKIKVDHKAE